MENKSKRKCIEKRSSKRIKIRREESDAANKSSHCYFENACSSETVEEVLDDMGDEIDSALERNNFKNNFTHANVKNILRHIITNEYVLDMVRNTMILEQKDGGSLDSASFEPKLTRSKAKEMKKNQCGLLWGVSSAIVKEESTLKLLEKEYPEECSSDEDYKPIEDEYPTDDEELATSPKCLYSEAPAKELSKSFCIESSALEPSITQENVDESFEKDVSLYIDEIDKIAQRTRSKLCLNDKPLEEIEASFIAPDITLDMYDTNYDDEEWQEFLQDLSRPLDSTLKLDHQEMDDADDPEYKIQDEDVPDYNDLRYDNSVKITRDELNALMAEILEFSQQNFPYFEDDDEEYKSCNNAPSTVESDPSARNTESQWMTSDERLQLDEQMRMYVQILTQSYLLSHGNPELNFLNITTKLFLDEMKMFASREPALSHPSAFYAQNLDGALEIVNEYEELKAPMRARGASYVKKIPGSSVPPHVQRCLATSKVFIYPELLPLCGFSHVFEKQKVKFSVPEDNLIALGIERFSDVKNPVDYIQSLLVPTKTVEQIKVRIKNSKVKKSTLDNPIKFYHVHKRVPQFSRVIRIFDPDNIKTPEDYPPDVLPKWMESYSKLANHSPGNARIAPNMKTPPKSPAVRVMFRKPLEPRKPSPILPRGLHFSPLKQISPILKKYSQQRRIVPAVPFPVVSPLKKKPAGRANLSAAAPPLKPKPASLANQFRAAPPPLKPKPASLANQFRAVPPLKPKPAPSDSPPSDKALKDQPSPSIASNTRQAVASSSRGLGDAAARHSAAPQNAKDLKKASTNRRASAAEGASKSKEKATEAEDDHDDEASDDKQGAIPPVVVAPTKKQVSKKRNRIQRDLEASLTLLQPTLMRNDPKKEEREMLFANSYLLRASEILKGSPELYKQFLAILCKHHLSTRSPVDLYNELKVVLKDYPVLVRDFVVFLDPEQAKECGMYKDHIVLTKMREFFRKIEVHFQHQPQQISRILKALAQLQHQVDIASTDIIAVLQPLLRNQSHLVDELNHLFPDSSPPDYLMTDFETIQLPNSDDDNCSIDSFEEIEIPDTPDPCGGKECPCTCHSATTDAKMLNKSRHCVKCGVKFIDGRIYIQTGKVLKPAQVTYHDACPPERSKVESCQLPPPKAQPEIPPKIASQAESSSKTDMSNRKDVHSIPSEMKRHLLPPCDASRMVSNTKLPCDVIEDTVFPSVANAPSQSTTPSDFSHLKDMIGSPETPGVINPELTKLRPNQNRWTKDEDRLILYNCQRFGISKKAFSTTSNLLERRTVEEVEERFLNMMKQLSADIKGQ